MGESWQTNWKDYYAILGVDRNSTAEQIKKKYRKLAAKYHPDLHADSDKAKMEELMKDVNEAYSILGEKAKKEEYDRAYDNKTYRNSEEESVTYEEAVKNYTAEEKRYAKSIALKELIKEELEKIDQIIDAKNEILFSVMNTSIDNKSYYNSVKELYSISYEYIKNLEDLLKEAIKYELNEETEVLKNKILFLEEELRKVPKSKSKAKAVATEIKYNEELKKEMDDLISKSGEMIKEFDNIPIYCKDRMLNPMNYNEVIESLLTEAKDIISKLRKIKELYQIKEYSGSEEIKTIASTLAKLKARINSLPEDYDEALIKGQNIELEEEIKDFQNRAKAEISHFDRFINSLNLNPEDPNYAELYEQYSKQVESLIEEGRILLSKTNKTSYAESSNITAVLNIGEEAVKIFEQAETVHNQANNIYNTAERYYLTEGSIKKILSSSLGLFDKEKALELFVEASKLLEKLQCIKEHTHDFRSLNREINDILLSLDNYKKRLQSEFNQTIYGKSATEILHQIKTLKSELREELIPNVGIAVVSILTDILTCMSIATCIKHPEKINPLRIILTVVGVIWGITCSVVVIEEAPYIIQNLKEQAKYQRVLEQKYINSK